MKACFAVLLYGALTLSPAIAPAADTTNPKKQEAAELKACAELTLSGFRQISDTREQRFEGKVSEAAAICRGGQKTLQFRLTPWVDWSHYRGTGDMSSLPSGYISTKGPDFRGVSGAMLDLESDPTATDKGFVVR